jgi:hypothetical protein
VPRSIFLKKYIPSYVDLDKESCAAIRKRLADIYVWHIGNGIYRKNGEKVQACKSIIKGIRLKPLKLSYWKTLAGVLIK